MNSLWLVVVAVLSAPLLLLAAAVSPLWEAT